MRCLGSVATFPSKSKFTCIQLPTGKLGPNFDEKLDSLIASHFRIFSVAFLTQWARLAVQPRAVLGHSDASPSLLCDNISTGLSVTGSFGFTVVTA